MQVTKRGGLLVEFDMSKVKQVIEWACYGLDVRAIELESHIDLIFTSGISTSKIQENLIQHAARLTSFEQPDWRFVAGRLVLMPRWKNNLGIKSFPRFVESQVKSGEYSPRLLETYTDEELEHLGSMIVNGRDLEYDYAGANILNKRYLLEGESPQIALMATAAMLAIPENPVDRIAFIVDTYEALSLRKISLATPQLKDLRKPNPNLASCFVLTMQDSLEGICDTWREAANISKVGGGVGINVSNIRAAGASIKGKKGASNGTIPGISVLNQIALYIDQGGSRAGAFSTGMEVWHADLEEFLELQTETGDLRKKSFDIFPQLIVSDSFMKAAKEGSDWYLFDPHEVRTKFDIDLVRIWGTEQAAALQMLQTEAIAGNLSLFKIVSAKAILKKVIRNYLETGLPYLMFKDNWNRGNPNKHDGLIECLNICQESSSNIAADLTHVCQLVSICYGNIDLSEVPHIARLATRMLNNSIELTTFPSTSSARHNDLYRVIGVGALGLADMLADNLISYNSPKAIEFVNELFDDVAYYTALESVALAITRGAYARFEGSDWDDGSRTALLATRSKTPQRWEDLQDAIDIGGIHNSQLCAIAPNTSSSLVIGNTASVLPTFSKFFVDNNSNGVVPVMPKYIKEYPLGYQEYKRVSHSKMISLISAIQFWTDTGISFETVFDLNDETVTAKYIYDTIFEAHEAGIKSLYYARFINKSGDTSKTETCESCAN